MEPGDQLRAIERELERARDLLHDLAGQTGDEAWGHSPGPGRWSVGECIVHLNLTSAAFLPLIEAALAKGRTLPPQWARPYRRDPLGWILGFVLEPPPRFRVSAPAIFLPDGGLPRLEAVGEFGRLQADLVRCVRAADGLPLGRLVIRSPFDARVRYNLYSCLRLIPAHQRRHLWQANRILEALPAHSA